MRIFDLAFAGIGLIITAISIWGLIKNPEFIVINLISAFSGIGIFIFFIREDKNYND